MRKVDVELDIDAIGESLLKSPEIKDFLMETANGIAQKCGEGYKTDTHMLSGRVVASVYTATRKAVKDNEKNNTLLKAVD